jgi:DNA polymerase family A
MENSILSLFLKDFREIWLCDFEFNAPPGERPDPICLVAWEFRSGRKIRLWRDRFGLTPPYSTARDSLFVAYFASAEIGCHLSLNWPKPAWVLDLFTEFRNHTNGLQTIAGNGLVGALTQYGLDGIGATEKENMRDLVLRGGPWTSDEQIAILDYCESDVAALARLLPAMLPSIDLPRAIYRGRYMAAVASMEHTGIPLGVANFDRLRDKWISIPDQLIVKIDSDYHVYEGRTFKTDRFERWLIKHEIPWQVLESGRLALDDDTFRDMARVFPSLTKLHELRHALSKLRLNDLAVGRDGFNRCLLSPFSSRTSRNQPSNKEFIFGPSVWLRGLIEPKPGWGLAYIDWSQQEIGIAAALSNDSAMKKAYESGDFYLSFAKQAKAVPDYATKETHEPIRDQFKQCALGVQYGIGEESLALRINQAALIARHLLQLHREVYHEFWKWSDNTIDRAILYGSQATVFGWTHHIPRYQSSNPRSIRNFHMQANGAEILRLACCLGTEHGILICAPVHDAVLITAPIDRLEADIAAMRKHMEQASETVLAGFKLRTDVKTIIHPNHYSDKRGVEMWDTVMSLL